MLPFLLIFIAGILVISVIMSAFGAIAEGGQLSYNEEQFQDFANAKYEQIFSAQGYEDNILLVFLTTEENSEGYFIAWVGDHIATDINMMFGNESTELGRAANASINGQNYKYQLDSGIAMVLDTMAGHIERRGASSALKCKESAGAPISVFENYTTLPLTVSTVSDAALDFADRTGIHIAVVVEEAEDIFEVDYSAMITGFIIAGALIAVAVVLIVKGVQSNKKEKDRNDTRGSGGGGNFYSDAGY